MLPRKKLNPWFALYEAGGK